MTKREELRQLVDELSDADVDALLGVALRLKVTMAPTVGDVPPVLANAPYDEEPLSDEFLARVAEAEADLAAGRVISSSEAKRLLLG